jgi:hypothetical protein
LFFEADARFGQSTAVVPVAKGKLGSHGQDAEVNDKQELGGRTDEEGRLVPLSQGVATDSAGRFFPLDLGKQPHGENHEKAEECDDVLSAIVPKPMLVINGNGRHQDDKQRKREFDPYGHSSILK